MRDDDVACNILLSLRAGTGKTAIAMGMAKALGRGLHLTTSQLNLSRVCHNITS
jgi:DNA helicase TIP49 (TBP-interacting protein)